MGGLRTSPKSFARTYRRKADVLRQLSAGLPNNPSPGEVHDLRVASRRVQAMCRLLPKEARGSRRYKEFDRALKSFFRATSRVRDLDTQVETLETVRTLLPDGLLSKLRDERNEAASRLRAVTTALSGASTLAVDSAQLGTRKVSRRLRRRVNKRVRAAEDLAEQVLGDESKVEELHALRMEVKKLRYLLELADERPSRLAALTKWQEALGKIHDLDVAIAYLGGDRLKSTTVGALIVLRRRRRASYRRFVQAGSKRQPLGTGGFAGFLRLKPLRPREEPREKKSQTS